MARGAGTPAAGGGGSGYAGPALGGAGDQVRSIGNKHKRSEVFRSLVKKARKAQRKARNAARRRGDAGEDEEEEEDGTPKKKKQTQRTIENTRIFDEYGAGVPRPAASEGADADADAAPDELEEHYNNEVEPRVLITTGWKKPSKATYAFVADLLKTFPSAYFYKRESRPLHKVFKLAAEKQYTAVVVLGEDQKKITSLSVSNLPKGPTAMFRVSNVVLAKDIKGHGRPTSHRPEVLLNNFKTKMGVRVGRLLGSLFNNDPQFVGRRAVTFHNQRDYIFFRHHRYIFETKPNASVGRDEKGVRARLQELGPRFTLRLDKVRKGPPGLAGEELDAYLEAEAAREAAAAAAAAAAPAAPDDGGAAASAAADAANEAPLPGNAAPPPTKRTRRHPTKLSEIRAMTASRAKRPLEYEEAMTRKALKAEAGNVQGVRRRKFVL